MTSIAATHDQAVRNPTRRADVAQLHVAAAAFGALATRASGRSSHPALVRHLTGLLQTIAFAARAGVDSGIVRDLADATGVAVALAIDEPGLRCARRTVDESLDMLEMVVRDTSAGVVRRGVKAEDWLRPIGARVQMVSESFDPDGDAAVELIGCLATAVVLAPD